MVTFLIIIAVIVGCSILFVAPEIFLVLVIAVICVGSCVHYSHQKIEPTETEQPAPPSNATPDEPQTLKNSVVEQCIDGVTYLLVTKDGKIYPPAPKQDRWGYNIRCDE